MATYEKRPERETTVEAFKVGGEPPGWFAEDKRKRWRRLPGWFAEDKRGRRRRLPEGDNSFKMPGRYTIRRWLQGARGWEWRDAPDGSYVVYNGPDEDFTLMSAERFEWLYREHRDCPKNTSEGATEIDAPASETAHSGGPTGEHTACSYD